MRQITYLFVTERILHCVNTLICLIRGGNQEAEIQSWHLLPRS